MKNAAATSVNLDLFGNKFLVYVQRVTDTQARTEKTVLLKLQPQWYLFPSLSCYYIQLPAKHLGYYSSYITDLW